MMMRSHQLYELAVHSPARMCQHVSTGSWCTTASLWSAHGELGTDDIRASGDGMIERECSSLHAVRRRVLTLRTKDVGL